jgi:hypothetical protein
MRRFTLNQYNLELLGLPTNTVFVKEIGPGRFKPYQE